MPYIRIGQRYQASYLPYLSSIHLSRTYQLIYLLIWAKITLDDIIKAWRLVLTHVTRTWCHGVHT